MKILSVLGGARLYRHRSHLLRAVVLASLGPILVVFVLTIHTGDKLDADLVHDKVVIENNIQWGLGGKNDSHNRFRLISVNKSLTKVNEMMNHGFIQDGPSKRKKETELCPLVQPGTVGVISVSKTVLSWLELHSIHGDLGRAKPWSPPHCVSRHKVAILIPYRNREDHLKVLVNHMVPFLKKQLIVFKIFVIEQALRKKFNKGILMNIGFFEAYNLWQFECVIMHDVDLLPEDDRNVYTCPAHLRHMSVNVDKFGYRLSNVNLVGGVMAYRTEVFIKLDGYSIRFFGWGGEDDEMSNRIYSKNMTISRYPNEVSRYKMIKHNTDKGNEANSRRVDLINENKKRSFANDGLSTITGLYKVLQIVHTGLITWIRVELNEDLILKETTENVYNHTVHVHVPSNTTTRKNYKEKIKHCISIKVRHIEGGRLRLCFLL